MKPRGRLACLPPAVWLAGTALAFTKRYDEARVIPERAPGLDPANDDVPLALARVTSWQGDHRTAEDWRRMTRTGFKRA